MTFQELLGGFVERFGSQTALGRAVGMSASRINKVLKGRDTFDVANCLRLAEATGETPGVILRTAGKADVQELIERLYGEARPRVEPVMTPAQRQVITLFESMSDDGRESALGILESIAKALPRVELQQQPQSRARSARSPLAAKSKARGTR